MRVKARNRIAKSFFYKPYLKYYKRSLNKLWIKIKQNQFINNEFD